MAENKTGSANELPLDEQPIEQGKLDDDAKLDIAIQGSMMTSEPPQIAEPKTTADDADEAGRDD